MEKSLRQRIYDYLREWHRIDCIRFIPGIEFEKYALEAGYKASNASRRLRELEQEGFVEKRETIKGHVEYRYKPETDRTVVIWQETYKMQERVNQMNLI